MKLASGHTVVEMEEEELKKKQQHFPKHSEGMIRLEPGRWFFRKQFLEYADKIYNFKWIPSDVCVMTYPKCGTTWMQEIIWTMRNNPDLDNPMNTKPLFERSPFLEADMLPMRHEPDDPLTHAFNKMCPGKSVADGLMLQLVEALPKPRTIKTHLSFSLVSPNILDNAKVVFVARNPKDAIVSSHHHGLLTGYQGTFEEYVKYFVADDLMFSPYWLMLKEAWERRSHPNMHIVTYEELKIDAKGEIRKLNDFIGTGLTDKQIDNVTEWTSFKSMKERGVSGQGKQRDAHLNQEVLKKDGGFMRKGVTGDWKNKFTPELEALADEWIQKHLGPETGINFKYEI